VLSKQEASNKLSEPHVENMVRYNSV
jgi:hypothetical protein